MSESIMQLPVETAEQRIQKALQFAVAYGGIEGAHHKDWTIDQMVRALTGCPVEVLSRKDGSAFEFEVPVQGTSEAYKSLVADACGGKDGPNTYSWSTGIAP